MTLEEQRIKIAEWCGYERNREKGGEISPAWWSPDKQFCLVEDLPDYLNDRNAMIGVLRDKVCGDVCLEKSFIKHLNAILDRRADDDAGPVICEYEMTQITAPANDFAEALLKTIGKWTE